MKRKTITTIILAIILVTTLSSLTFADDMPFKDIESSYAKEEILALYKDGIFSGKGEDVFKPKDNMTRAELAKVLVLSLKLKEDKEAAKPFKDVPQDQWYAGYVGALVKSGITDGTSATTFTPNRNVTRQELAVFFIRALGLEDKAKEFKIESSFSDKGEIDSWAKDHVGLATEIGLITGIKNSDGTTRFEPKTFAERQVLAVVTYRFNYHRDEYLAKLKEPVQTPQTPSETPKEEKPTTPSTPSTPEEPENPSPTKPIEPTEPEKPLPKDPIDPPKPVEPPVVEDGDDLKVNNINGKQMSFLGSYLISVEFDIDGNIGGKEIKVIINEGTADEMTLKLGTAKSYDYYFDGMVGKVDTITLYIGNERIDLTNNITWN